MRRIGLARVIFLGYLSMLFGLNGVWHLWGFGWVGVLALVMGLGIPVFLLIVAPSLVLRLALSVQGLGMLCNVVVVVANGGVMPVVGLPIWDDRDLVHVPAEGWHRLLILADRFVTEDGSIYSAGDVLLAVGLVSAVVCLLCRGSEGMLWYKRGREYIHGGDYGW